MKFIFPKNYNFKPKLFGFIEYSTAILDVIIGIFLYNIINFIFTNINIKIYLFISLFFPIFLISVLGISRESFISVFRYIFKFIKNQNIYLYKKNSSIKCKKSIFIQPNLKEKNSFKKRIIFHKKL